MLQVDETRPMVFQVVDGCFKSQKLIPGAGSVPTSGRHGGLVWPINFWLHIRTRSRIASHLMLDIRSEKTELWYAEESCFYLFQNRSWSLVCCMTIAFDDDGQSRAPQVIVRSPWREIGSKKPFNHVILLYVFQYFSLKHISIYVHILHLEQ